MNLNEYQRLAQRTKNPDLDNRDQILNGALGLAGEAGEVADVIKKWAMQGHPLDEDKIRSELGDVLWYLATLANELCLELNDIAQANIAKLRARFPDGFSEERSRNRDEAVPCPAPEAADPPLDCTACGAVHPMSALTLIEGPVERTLCEKCLTEFEARRAAEAARISSLASDFQRLLTEYEERFGETFADSMRAPAPEANE